MKKTLIIITLAAMAACTNKPDFTKVKNGMTTDQVKIAIGEPTRKQNMAIAEWWYYGDNQVVVIMNDSVANVVPDAKKAAAEINAAMDSMNAQMDSISKILSQ